MVNPLSSSLSSGPMRMFGLASGLDIDSMVEKLMTAERQPLFQMQQQEQRLEWKRDTYRDMNALLLDLRNATLNMSLQSSFLTKKATSTNQDLVSVVAGSGAPNTTFTLTNAEMATAARNVSQNKIADADFDSSKSLWAMRDQLNFGSPFQDLVTEEVNGENIKADQTGKSFKLDHSYIVDDKNTTTIKVNGEVYNVSFSQSEFDQDKSENKVLVDPTTGKLTFNHDIDKDSEITADYSYGTPSDIKFSITTADKDGKPVKHDFNFSASTSLDTILKRVSSEAGVTAFYDTASGKVSITRNQTGDYLQGPEMQFDGSFLTDILQLDSDNEVGGTDAKVTINGLETTRHDNTFTFNNVTFTLKDDIPASQKVTVSVTDDSDGIFDNIKNWVDKYNDTIKKINDKLGEPVYRDYPPLTSDQKKDMKDDDIKLWNEKAQSGMLSDDNILRSALTQFRTQLYTKVNGVDDGFNQLASIGITTSSDYKDHGKLVIDEDKLKQAIAENPEAVMNLFTKTGNTEGDQGIMKRLTDSMKKAMDSVKQKAGSEGNANNQFAIGLNIQDYEARIKAFQDHLTDVQTRYYQQFTAMEQAIQQANQQSAFLMNNLGGGS